MRTTTNLIGGTEKMRIVLTESPYPCQTRQRPACLIPMQHSKISEAERELAVGSFPHAEHQAVAGAIHRFETKGFLFDVEPEHVLRVWQALALRSVNWKFRGRVHFSQ